MQYLIMNSVSRVCQEHLHESCSVLLGVKEPARLAALRRGNAGSVTGVGLEVGFDTTSSSSAQSELVVRAQAILLAHVIGSAEVQYPCSLSAWPLRLASPWRRKCIIISRGVSTLYAGKCRQSCC